MRRTLPLSFFITGCVLLCDRLIAQDIHVDPGTSWHEELWRYEGLESHHADYIITVGEDTLIAGQAYMKLRRSGMLTITQLTGQNPPPPVVIPFDEYLGALRVDVAALRWWAVLPGSGSEILLYDFDLSVGADVSGIFGDCGGEHTVTGMDEVWFAGAMRQRFFLDGGFRYIIRGIGASSGLFGYLCQFFEEYSCLQTWTQDGEELVVDGCAAVATGSAEITHGRGALAYPNPTSGSCVLGDGLSGEFITVQDATGRVVGVLRATSGGRVDLAPFAPGGYVLRARERAFPIVRE